MFIEQLIPIVAIIFTFGIPGIVIIVYLYIRHRERIRMIEKGMTPEEVKMYFSKSEKQRKVANSYSALKWGLILTFIGLGIFMANLLYELYGFDEGVSFGVILIFAGLGFLIYFFAVNRTKEVGTESHKTDLIN